MLLQRTEHLPEGSARLYELDGYRAIAAKSAGRVHLWSRNETILARYPAIAAALAKLPDETVVDGEIVALDDRGKPSFNALQHYGSSKTPLIYYLFDLPILRGRDLQNERLDACRELLDGELLPQPAEPIRASPVLRGALTELIQAVKEQGLEVLVGKRRDIVVKNNTLGQIKWEQMVFEGNPQFVVDLQPIDVGGIAMNCGAAGFTIERPEQTEEILQQTLAHDGPAVVQAVVDPNEPPMPGNVSTHQFVKFSEAQIKGQKDGWKILKTVMKNKIREGV